MAPNETVYKSIVRIERVKGALRHAYLPVDEQPILFGLHSEVAEHYGIDTTTLEPHATTLDYVVAATAGWLTGTFGGALEARGVPADEGRLISEAVGEIEKEDDVLIIRRIHVTYHLKIDQEKREIAERVHGFHAERCALARTIDKCVAISTSLELESGIVRNEFIE